MKKIVPYFLLLLFVFQSTSNLWIISSFYINRNYIAKELCINRFDTVPVCKGACYLEKKIADNQKGEQKIPNAKEKEMQLFLSPAIASAYQLMPPTESARTVGVKRNDAFKSTFINSIYHPPKLA